MRHPYGQQVKAKYAKHDHDNDPPCTATRTRRRPCFPEPPAGMPGVRQGKAALEGRRPLAVPLLL